MFKEQAGEGQSDLPQMYIRPSELAKILGWNRTSVYYWLNRCEIQVTTVAGHKLIPIYDLPALIVKLQAARTQAHAQRLPNE